jgi:hypothetical protein
MGNESDAGNGTDQEVKPNNAVKPYRKLREQDMRLKPLCDEVIKLLLS